MKNFSRILTRLFIIPASIILFKINYALAQQNSAFFTTGTPEDINAVGKGSFADLVVTIINYFLGLLGLIAVGFIIYAGVLMVTSSGSEDAVGKGRKIITYAVIGIVIILLSYTVVTFVTDALG